MWIPRGFSNWLLDGDPETSNESSGCYLGCARMWTLDVRTRSMMRVSGLRFLVGAVALGMCITCWGQDKRKVIIDQDAAGPAGTDLQSTLLLIQSPETEVLGITVVTGDMWLNAEVAHTLRMLELIG